VTWHKKKIKRPNCRK